MKATLERELKLDVEPGFALPPLPGEPLERRVFTSTYHDTPDLRLLRAGITMRHRVENGLGRWQLKLPRGHARLELEHVGGPVELPSDMRELLVARVRDAALGPVATLQTRRTGVRVDDDGQPLAEVVLDEVTALEGRHTVGRFSEVEVELLEGDERTLDRLGRRLRRAGAREGDGRPKVLRILGDGAAAPDAPEQASDGPERLAAAMAEQHEAILAHDPGVRLGDTAEDVHQMRVATRRLRSFLRTGESLLEPHWTETLRRELGWLADLLGGVRDLDVLLEYFEAEAATLEPAERTALEPFLAALRSERETARDVLMTGLRSERYLALLDRLDEPPPFVAAAGAAPTLASLAAAEVDRLRKSMRKIDADDSPDEEVHAVRIKGKRARYSVELASPALGNRAERFLDRAKALQDVLGDHQDASVAEERIRLFHDEARGDAAIAAGRLIERQHERRRKARRELPDAWGRLEGTTDKLRR